MTVGRVTTTQIWASSASSIQASKARLAHLTDQASSGLAVSRPSDDPAAAAAILTVLSRQSTTDRYGTNIADGLSWLSTADTTLTSAENLVRQASDLTIQAANSATSTPTARLAIAVQLEGIRDDLMGAANAKHLGRSVFAGTSDAATAFDPATFAYAGSAGAAVQRRIGDGAGDVVTVSADGAAAFGVGSDSVFQRIQDVVDALRSPAYDTDTSAAGPQQTVRAGIDALSAALTALTAQHAVVGAGFARLTGAKAANATTAIALETQRSGLQDADTTKTLLDLKTQELAYQTALQVTAQVIQPTLMSFLS
jgi:flagellar hook-associated protein 3 FlgL